MYFSLFYGCLNTTLKVISHDQDDLLIKNQETACLSSDSQLKKSLIVVGIAASILFVGIVMTKLNCRLRKFQPLSAGRNHDRRNQHLAGAIIARHSSETGATELQPLLNGHLSVAESNQMVNVRNHRRLAEEGEGENSFQLVDLRDQGLVEGGFQMLDFEGSIEVSS